MVKKIVQKEVDDLKAVSTSETLPAKRTTRVDYAPSGRRTRGARRTLAVQPAEQQVEAAAVSAAPPVAQDQVIPATQPPEESPTPVTPRDEQGASTLPGITLSESGVRDAALRMDHLRLEAASSTRRRECVIAAHDVPDSDLVKLPACAHYADVCRACLATWVEQQLNSIA